MFLQEEKRTSPVEVIFHIQEDAFNFICVKRQPLMTNQARNKEIKLFLFHTRSLCSYT